jgi:hypothetical protein
MTATPIARARRPVGAVRTTRIRLNPEGSNSSGHYISKKFSGTTPKFDCELPAAKSSR